MRTDGRHATTVAQTVARVPILSQAILRLIVDDEFPLVRVRFFQINFQNAAG